MKEKGIVGWLSTEILITHLNLSIFTKSWSEKVGAKYLLINSQSSGQIL
jgi:hypothetical protein